MAAARDYYSILGIPRTSTKEEIKKAFRAKARELHPDVCDEPDAEDRFKEILEAYEILADDAKRANYDLNGKTMDSFNFEDFTHTGDIDDIFGEEWFKRAQGRPAWRTPYAGPVVGESLKEGVLVTLEEVYAGCMRMIEVPQITECTICHGSGASPGTGVDVCPVCRGLGQIKQVHGRGYSRYVAPQSCPKCYGSGKIVRKICEVCHGRGKIYGTRTISVNVPAGVESGTSLRLAGEGKEGLRGGRRGDLYVTVTVAPHDRYEREGADLLTRVEIPMVRAALGGEVEVETLSGRARLTVPAGTQNGTLLRMRGFGLPAIQSQSRGDLLVEVAVRTPSNMTARQREIMTEFARESGERVEGQPPPKERGRKRFKFF